MPDKPFPCRVHAFFDGQNLFHAAKRAFGYTFPNFDPRLLASAIVGLYPGRVLTSVHFYTGIPPANQNLRWNEFWSAKIRAMKTAGINVTTRTLRYSVGPVVMPDGTVQQLPIPREKGIDLRIALDLLRLARTGEFDCALIFSQDGDLAEVVQEIVSLRSELDRWLVVDCAFPLIANGPKGIAGARAIPFDQALYDKCVDPVDYFPPQKSPTLPGIV